MDILNYILLFVLGCFIGSFLNVVTDRIPEGKSIIWGRSYCDNCRKHLTMWDLFPVLSFAFLKGKCRYCKQKLSYYYPTGEIVTGITFALVGFVLFNQGKFYLLSDFRYLALFIYYLFTASSLIVIFFTDMKYGIIPFKVVFFAFITTFLWCIFLLYLYITHNQLPFLHFNNTLFTLNYIFSAAGVFLFFLLLFMGTRGRGIGFGDVVFVALMGFILGFPKIVLAIYISFLTGAIVSLILVLLGRKHLSGGTIPFGPFLVFGTCISLFGGDILIKLITMYLLHL